MSKRSGSIYSWKYNKLYAVSHLTLYSAIEADGMGPCEVYAHSEWMVSTKKEKPQSREMDQFRHQ